MKIPASHPRYESLKTREALVEAARRGVVAPQGLIAHGRGEAFDYILGEKTNQAAKKAITASAATLLTARSPVISVNGNTAALVPNELVKLAAEIPAKLEVNLFHRTSEREKRISTVLKRNGAKQVLGVGTMASGKVPGLKSMRRRVDPSGIEAADVVLVPLEDGDRAAALVRMGKEVIAIDLNPLSRTSRSATITIVDNVTRALPELVAEVRRVRSYSPAKLKRIVSGFDNQQNLAETVREITRYLERWNGASEK